MRDLLLYSSCNVNYICHDLRDELESTTVKYRYGNQMPIYNFLMAFCVTVHLLFVVMFFVR